MFLEEIRQNSARLGERPALCAGEEQISWGALWPRAESLAARLRAEGEGPVAVLGVREVWVPAAFLACLIAGRPYLPLDPALPAARRRVLLERTGARPLTRADWEAAVPGGRCAAAEAPEGIAYLLFTSGSTGVPKQVAVSRRNLEHFLRWARSLPGVAGTAGRGVLGQAALSFDLSVADVYLSLTMGGVHTTLTAGELGDFRTLFRRLEEAGPALLVGTPSFLRLCLRDAAFAPARLPGLRTVFSCGEALPPRTAGQLLERFPGLTLLNAYGPTEATCAVSAVAITREMCARPLPIGRMGEGAVELSLEDGEIVLRGESVAPAYGGVYPTGDLGHVENGLLYFDGRRDDQIKYRGYRIEPAEIEAALESLPGVERACVLPRRAGGQVRGLTAFVETGQRLRPEELAGALARRLPAYLIPGEWRFSASLPLTPNGKCDRKRLEEQMYGA